MILEHSGAKVLIVGERYAGLLDVVDRSSVAVLAVGTIEGVPSLAEARAVHPQAVPDDRTPGGLFVYTSGTTGKPKGIRRPIPAGDVGQVANDSALFGRAFDFRPFDGPMLVSTGMFHGGPHSYYMGGLHVSHALVIMSKFDPEETLQLIEKFHIRSGYMVPTQLHWLMKLPDEVRDQYDVSSLHSIVHSAAPCPRPLKEALMAWWGPVVWETYGGMEGAATIAKPQRWLEKPGPSAGRSRVCACSSSTTTATSCRRARSATSTWRTGSASPTTTTPTRPPRRSRASASASATSATWTPTATSSSPTGPRT